MIDFTKIWSQYRKKSKKNNYTPPSELVELYSDIYNNEILSIYSEKYKELIYNSSSIKSDFDLILEDIKKDLAEWEDKAIGKELLKINLNEIDNINNKKISEAFINIDTYKKDMAVIKKEKYIINELNKNLKVLFENINISSLKIIFDTNYTKLNNLYDDVMLYIKTEKKLTKEILSYSTEVTKLQQKYKLSIDWNGNKKRMIILGNELKTKRESLIKEEKKLISKIKSIYPTMKLLNKEFKIKSIDIIDYLNNELNILKTSMDITNSINIIYDNLIKYLDLYYE